MNEKIVRMRIFILEILFAFLHAKNIPIEQQRDENNWFKLRGVTSMLMTDVGGPPTFKRCHQDRNSVTNIQKLAPT